MNKLKKVLVFAVITLFVMLGVAFAQIRRNLTVDNEHVINNENSDIEEKQQTEEPVEEKDIVEEQSKQETQKVEQPKEPQKTELKKSSSSSVSNKSEQKTEAKPKEGTKKEDPVVTKPITEEKTNPWDIIGVTEYEYYNSPQFKWQNVTHKDLSSCQIEGNERLDDNSNNYTQFWCYEVSSYSGNRLGYMLELT